jgi:hypothetical protein
MTLKLKTVLAPVNISDLKQRLYAKLAVCSYDFVIGGAYGYNFESPLAGFMFLDALNNLEYLSSKEIQNLVKLVNSFINEHC